MKTAKTILALGLTLLLLLVGAVLPGLAGAIQNMTADQAGVREIQTVELNMKEPLTLIDKLHVMARGQFYPASDDTFLSVSSVQDVVITGLSPYYYRELVPYNWKNVSFTAEPYLLYSENAPERNYTIWICELEGKGWGLHMYVDDETGKILYTNYWSDTEQTAYTSTGYAQQFREAYFESLGLSEDEWHSIEQETEGNTTSIRSAYWGQTDHPVTLEFITFPNGFWVSSVE